MDRTMIAKRNALAQFLGCYKNEVLQDGIGEQESLFCVGSEEYLVLTDDEAEDLARERILDSVWAFNTDFLMAHVRDNGIDSDIIDMMKEKCESANAALLKLIDDVDHFVNDAINCDGRGHFIAQYDGEENEAGKFFVYRRN